LTRAVTIHDDQPGPGLRGRRLTATLSLSALLLVVSLGTTGCMVEGGGHRRDAADPATTSVDRGPNVASLPTLAGGVELVPVELARVLVGEGLAFGSPLPSEQAAADTFTEDPEVAVATARRVYSVLDGRELAATLVLTLDGGELFDQPVLDAFVAGVVDALGGSPHDEIVLAGRTVLRSQGAGGVVLGFVEGDQLVTVRGVSAGDTATVVERQLTAIAAGVVGPTEPVTPLVALPIEAAFVPVPILIYQPIPPPEEEPAPEPPVLAGATGLQGRYGVVAGERRTTLWVFAVDPAKYPSAEALTPAMAALVSVRSGGAPVEAVEVVDRVVQRATGPAGARSAAAFRHQALVVLIEGPDPAQVDAVASAWIVAL
jgi:hypothetical protein